MKFVLREISFLTSVNEAFVSVIVQQSTVSISLLHSWLCVRASSRVALPNPVMQRISDTRRYTRRTEK